MKIAKMFILVIVVLIVLTSLTHLVKRKKAASSKITQSRNVSQSSKASHSFTSYYPRECGWAKDADDSTIESIRGNFTYFKENGVECVNYGADRSNYTRAAEIAKEVGIQLYAWLPMLLGVGNNKKYLFDFHPEAYVITKSGINSHDKGIYDTNHYHFLCPNNPQVREFLKNLVGEVSSIPDVDGINLDYVRYIEQNYNAKYDPDGDTCYCQYCVSGFLNKTGKTITEVSNPSLDKDWNDYRVISITNLVNELIEVVHAKGKKVSADVYPGDSEKHCRQKWEDWNLDMVFQMIYTKVFGKKVDWIGSQTKKSIKKKKPKSVFYAGLQAESMNDTDFQKGVEYSLTNGTYGICLYQLTNINKNKFQIVKNAIRKFLKK